MNSFTVEMVTIPKHIYDRLLYAEARVQRNREITREAARKKRADKAGIPYVNQTEYTTVPKLLMEREITRPPITELYVISNKQIK